MGVTVSVCRYSVNPRDRFVRVREKYLELAHFGN